MRVRRGLEFCILVALSQGGCWFKRKPPAPPPLAAPQPAPPKPEPAKPEPVKPKPAAQPKPAPTPPPKLGAVVAPAQREELRRQYERSREAARRTLELAGQRTLSRPQSDSAARIRTFLEQAEGLLAKDPAGAAQLAQRAELLARELHAALSR